MSDHWGLPESRFKLSDWVSLPDSIADARLVTGSNRTLADSLDHHTELPGQGDDLWKPLGLKNNPFREALDTTFWFASRQQHQACLQLQMIIRNHLGFALVTGEAGVGKSLLSQKVLESTQESGFLPILVTVSPQISASSLLNLLLEELQSGVQGRAVFEKLSVYEKIKYFGQVVYHLLERNRHPVIFIDECHFLNRDVLHLLRTLNNFESKDRKCVTFVLFGEKQFQRKLTHASYKSLKSRLYLEIELPSLDMEETSQFIRHRLRLAGGTGNEFNEGQIKQIFDQSGGVPRLIHKYATQIALLSIDGSLSKS